MMSQFAMLTRLKEPENSSLFSKMLIYDGENLKDTDPRAKSYQEYRDYAGVDEGMSGLSTRFAFKILSKVFNFDQTEIAANPVHLMYVLEQQIEREQFPAETEQKYLGFIKEHLSARYAEFIGKEIQTAYLESYSEYGQNIFDRYVTYADYWIQDQEYRDTDTGEMFDRAPLNDELEKIEKPAGISNPKDFRNEIVNFVLRARANNAGKNPAWTSYEKLRTVIEKKMFSNTEELLPVISFNAKASADEAKKHENFVNRMVAEGLHAQAGAPALRVVPAGAQEQLSPTTSGTRMLQQIIDRRLAGKNKSIGNRERFLRRYQGQLREAVRKAVDQRGIRDIEQGEDIHLPKRDISEPTFGHGPGGAREIVHPGNQEYVRGDHIERPQGGWGAAAAAARRAIPARARTISSSTSPRKSSCRSSSTISRCRDMMRTQIAESARAEEPPRRLLERRHAEQPVGDPLDARRDQPPHRDRRRLARASCASSRTRWPSCPTVLDAAAGAAPRRSSKLQIAALRARLDRIPYIDPFDLRFRNRVRMPMPTAKAVMFCLMDVSGSMDEARKDLSKRFFILLYLFLTRHYEKIEIVFIRHHTQAQEVDEENFFHARETGGTVVSSALVLMDEIIKERYSPSDWNIYAAQASDGDNWHHDSRPLPRAADRQHPAEVPLLRLRAGRRRGAEPVGGIRAPAGGAEALRDAEGRRRRRRSIRCFASCSRMKELPHDVAPRACPERPEDSRRAGACGPSARCRPRRSPPARAPKAPARPERLDLRADRAATTRRSAPPRTATRSTPIRTSSR